MQYTNSDIESLKSLTQPITYEAAVAWASERDLSIRSVVAKIRGLGLPYKVKTAGVSKPAGSKRRTKATIAAEIQELLGAEFSSLTNMLVPDLEGLLQAIKELSDK